MILPESRTKEWLSEIVSKYKFRDQALIEKTIRAFSLLEALARSGLDFVFKGGSCLMLHFNTEKRLSIDIDIICPPGTRLEDFWDKYTEEYGFEKPELVNRQSMTDIPKVHAKYNYTVSYTDNRPDKILLDVLLEDHPYQDIVEKPIKSPFLKTDGNDILVRIPSMTDILGDKLTAYAPNTTGIPYFKENKKGEPTDCSLEIIKQMFDVACLIDNLDLFENVLDVYKKNVAVECGYRGLSGTTYEDVLKDTIRTSLCLAFRGKYDSDKYQKLQEGVQKIKSFIYDKASYGLEKAIADSAKIAHLCSCFLQGHSNFERYDQSKVDLLRDLSFDSSVDTEIIKWGKLNKLKISNTEAFYYWHKVFASIKAGLLEL